LSDDDSTKSGKHGVMYDLNGGVLTGNDKNNKFYDDLPEEMTHSQHTVRYLSQYI